MISATVLSNSIYDNNAVKSEHDLTHIADIYQSNQGFLVCLLNYGPLAVGKAIGTEDSILIVVTEAAPKTELYQQPSHYPLLHYFTLF